MMKTGRGESYNKRVYLRMEGGGLGLSRGLRTSARQLH